MKMKIIETFDQWMSRICNGAVRELPTASSYRWSDVFDYVCKYMRLDENFGKIVEAVIKRNYDLTLQEAYQKSLPADKISQSVAAEIIEIMEAMIKEGIY